MAEREGDSSNSLANVFEALAEWEKQLQALEELLLKSTKKVYRRSSGLRVIGQSNIAANLETLARSAERGALPVEPETIEELHAACAAIQDMRMWSRHASTFKRRNLLNSEITKIKSSQS